jgi:hypothetical protein
MAGGRLPSGIVQSKGRRVFNPGFFTAKQRKHKVSQLDWNVAETLGKFFGDFLCDPSRPFAALRYFLESDALRGIEQSARLRRRG